MSTPPISQCLEGYDEFKCHSTPENVFNAMAEDSLPVEDVDISSNAIGVTMRFENNVINIKDSSVRDTNKIYLTMWDFIGYLKLSFIDTAGKIEDSVFDVEVDSVAEQWFMVGSKFEDYNDFKIEIRNGDDILIYEKVLK